MKQLIGIFFSFSLLIWGSNASASLIGDEVFLTCMQDSGSSDPLCEGKGAVSATVDAGVEYPDYFNFQNSLSIDVAAESVYVTFDNGPFCGWFTCDGQGYLEFWLTDLDWVGMPNGIITGLDVVTNMQGVLTDFGDNSVHFSLPETQVTSDMFLTLNLLTNEKVSVPAPAMITIFAIGLFGLVLRRRMQE